MLRRYAAATRDSIVSQLPRTRTFRKFPAGVDSLGRPGAIPVDRCAEIRSTPLNGVTDHVRV